MATTENDLLGEFTEFVVNLDSGLLDDDQKGVRKTLLRRATAFFELDLSDAPPGSVHDSSGSDDYESDDEDQSPDSEPLKSTGPLLPSKPIGLHEQSKELANSSTEPNKKEDNEIDSSYDISDEEDDIYVKQQVQRYKRPGIQRQFTETKMEYKDVVLFAKHYGSLFKKRKSAFMKKVDKLEALACAGQLMLYKDYNLFLVIKPDTEHEGALITTEPKSPLNIFLEVSNKKYEFKVGENNQRDAWIVALNSCFNCKCKRTDLMCKEKCIEKMTGLDEVYDELEIEKEEENIYDEPDLDGDSKGKNLGIADFEKRWEDKVRLIPEGLDSSYVYYDPHEEESSRQENDKPIKKIAQEKKLKPTGSSSPSLSNSSKVRKPVTPAKPVGKSIQKDPSLNDDDYTDNDDDCTDDEDDDDDDYTDNSRDSEECETEDESSEKDDSLPPPSPDDSDEGEDSQPVPSKQAIKPSPSIQHKGCPPPPPPKHARPIPTTPVPPIPKKPGNAGSRALPPAPPPQTDIQSSSTIKVNENAELKNNGFARPNQWNKGTTPNDDTNKSVQGHSITNPPKLKPVIGTKPVWNNEQKNNFQRNNQPVIKKDVPPIPVSPDKPVQLKPNVAPRFNPVSEESGQKEPSTTKVETPFQRKMRLAQEAAASGNPSPAHVPRTVTRKQQFGGTSSTVTEPTTSMGPRPGGPRKVIIKRPQGPMPSMADELAMKLAQRKKL